ncbi:MAG TPA: hypothetical protein VF144_09910 [Chitinophagaceae bacterium]
MRNPSILKAILVSALFSVSCGIYGQAKQAPRPDKTSSVPAKPFKVLTNGRQITLQSKQNFKSIMVWTASGHRFIEEKRLATNTYNFTVPSKEKIFYMMVETADGKRFTEKMGVK